MYTVLNVTDDVTHSGHIGHQVNDFRTMCEVREARRAGRADRRPRRDCLSAAVLNEMRFDDYFKCFSKRMAALGPILDAYGLELALEFIGPVETRVLARYDFVHTIDGVRCLTRTGRWPNGLEFILSDILGVSMLVDSINHRKPIAATESTILGPFYLEGVREVPMGTNIAIASRGEPGFCSGRVLSLDGQPLANAILDVWSADGDGHYDRWPGWRDAARDGA